jgi:outer membrane lipoprotein SlyB
MTQIKLAAIVASAALMLGACASPGGGTGEVEIRSGVIQQITLTEVKSTHENGVGAILGGIAGAGLGSLIGAGTGRDVAIAAGAIGGALAGNVVQNKYFDKPVPAQQIFVRLNSGVLIEITQPVNQSLYQGQRVYVEGSGTDARVVPASQ